MQFKRLTAILLALMILFSTSALAATEWVAKITATTKVYTSANKDSQVLGSVKSGTILSLLDTKDSWAKVKMDGKVGYVLLKNVKKTTKTMYVNVGTLTIYSSARSNSTKLAKLGYGASLSMEGINGEWARVKSGEQSGYCKYSALTDSDPNTLKTTVYTQEDDVEAFSLPNTSSASLGTVSKNTKMTCLAVYDDAWCRVKYGNKYGYIKKDLLDTKKVNPYSTARPVSGKSVEADWWKSGIQSIFGRGKTAVVTDVKTGISWTVYRSGGTNHADVQPKTAADTAAMKKACGSDYGTWNRRAIWVSVGGKKYAASMNCMPHGEGSIKDNNFNGHHCIHFTNSRTHGTNSVCSKHQNAIKQALKAG